MMYVKIVWKVVAQPGFSFPPSIVKKGRMDIGELLVAVATNLFCFPSATVHSLLFSMWSLPLLYVPIIFCVCICAFIHSFIRYVLNSYHVPHTFLSPELKKMYRRMIGDLTLRKLMNMYAYILRHFIFYCICYFYCIHFCHPYFLWQYTHSIK